MGGSAIKKRTSGSQHPSKKAQKKSRKAYDSVESCTGAPAGSVSNSMEIVVYDPSASVAGLDVQKLPNEYDSSAQGLQSFAAPYPYERVLPAVGAFTVQCSSCFKWRLIPTKEKYEEIREGILDDPFVCERAQEWRPDISCDDPADISQDGSRLWAIDKPNIAQPPPGWQRLLRIRGPGSSKFADIYYEAPTGKKLRSMVEVEKYLLDHPECIMQGVNLSQFSFLTPRPLDENYVRKKPAPGRNPYTKAGLGLPRLLEPEEVSPLAWEGPPTRQELQRGTPQKQKRRA